MKRRDVLKGIAALPVGAIAANNVEPDDFCAEFAADTAHHSNWQGIVEFSAGELVFLAGPHDCGKSNVALDIALQTARSGMHDVWFVVSHRSAEHLAGRRGLRVEPLLATSVVVEPGFWVKLYDCYQDGQRLPLVFVETPAASEAPLAALREIHPRMQTTLPGLIVYDDDFFSANNWSPGLIDGHAQILRARLAEANELRPTAIINTQLLTYEPVIDPAHERPTTEGLLNRARTAMVPERIYFISNVAKDDWTATTNWIGITGMERHQVVGTQRTRTLLIRNPATGDFRQANQDEALLAIGLGKTRWAS